MSQSVSANFDVRQMLALLQDTVGGVTSEWRVNFGASGLAALTRKLTAGTGARKATKMWYFRQAALGAGANDSWVIGAGGTTCKDRFNNNVNFTLLKWFYLAIVNPVAGNKLTVGNAGANPWLGWFGATNQTETVHIWTLKINDVDGWAVGANDTLKILNPTGGALAYDALAIGE